MEKRTLDQVEPSRLRDTPIVVRADLNVPLDDGEVADDGRIRASLPTLRAVTEAGSRVTLLSHLGRPGGAPDPSLSLEPVARRLDELLDAPVAFSTAYRGPEARRAVEELGAGEVLLLENTRFHPGETKNDRELAGEWASFGELFVNDAFGAAHRSHASTTGIARVVRERGGDAVAGHLMARELTLLGRVLADPQHPFVAILGGAKISGKIDVIHAFLARVDRLLIGGAMANTFFRALGLEVGKSLVEDDRIGMAADVLEEGGDRVILPTDVVVGAALEAGARTRVASRTGIEPDEVVGDVGPTTRELFARELATARSVVWNGPMGVFELEPFRGGTVAVARTVAEVADRGGLTVVGGGDSAAAADLVGVSDRLTHVSTGGGASLDFLAGAELPAVAALSDA